MQLEKKTTRPQGFLHSLYLDGVQNDRNIFYGTTTYTPNGAIITLMISKTLSHWDIVFKTSNNFITLKLKSYKTFSEHSSFFSRYKRMTMYRVKCKVFFASTTLLLPKPTHYLVEEYIMAPRYINVT